MLFVIDVPEKIYNKYANFVVKMYEEAHDKTVVDDQMVLTYILTNNKGVKEIKIHTEMEEIKKSIIEYDSML